MSVLNSGNLGEFDRLAEEFVERHRRLERPGLQEYIDRCPALANEIRELFPLLIEVEVAERALPAETEPSLVAAPAIRPADLVGDYQILREIGRGGMGIVYEAEQLSLGRRVALKILPRAMTKDATALARFRREARSAARLHHTNIVPVFDVGQDGHVVYYAMQFIPGQGLDHVIEELKRLRDESQRAKQPSDQAAARPDQHDQPGGVGPDAPTMAEVAQIPMKPAQEVARSLLSGRLNAETSSAVGGLEVLDPSGTAVMATPSASSALTSPIGDLDSHLASASTTGSAVLPGGTQLSAVESSGDRQPFYRSVAEIGRQAAAGLAHAHDRGIVHRDIKPSNLLLDAAGIVWISDFGLASTGDDGLTATGDILGTLRYMAPERFRGEGDPRADIYALGITLYELLTLRPAFDSPDRLQLAQQVRDHEPPRPKSIDPRIPRDLETILLKSIEKDPRRRYASAVEMGEDLRRYLAGEPIRARQVGEIERVWKWARRRPAIAGLILLATASMLTGTAVASMFALHANDRAAAARDAEARSKTSERTAENARKQAIVERDTSLRLSANLAVDRGIALAEGGQPELGLHWMLQALKTVPEKSGEFARMVRQNLGGWIEQVHEPLQILTQEQVNGDRHLVRFSPDGRTFATGSFSHLEPFSFVSLWDTASGRRLASFPGALQPVAFRPDGKVLVSVRDGLRSLGAIDLTTGQPIWTSPVQPFPFMKMGFLPNGTEVVVVRRIDFHDKDGDQVDEVQVWDAIAGRPVAELYQGRILDIADGKVLTVERDGDGVNRIILLDPSTRSRVEVYRSPGRRIAQAWIDPDGKSFWMCYNKNSAQLVGGEDLQRWNMQTRLSIGPVLAKAFTLSTFPAGDRILALGTADLNEVARYRDSTSGRPLGSTLRSDGPISDHRASPDGRLALLQSSYGTTYLWRIASDPTPPTVGAEASAKASDLDDSVRARLARVFRPYPQLALNGRAAVRWSQGSGGRAFVQVANLDDGRPVGRPARHRYETIRSLVLDAEGARFATGSDPGTLTGEVRIWETATGRPLGPPMTHGNYVSALAFQPGGRLLAAGDYQGMVRLWDTTTGLEVGKPLVQKAIVWSLAFSPDGRTLAVGHHHASAGKPGVLLWDVETGRPIGDLLRSLAPVAGIAFRPDGGMLLASDGVSLQVWDAVTRRPIGDTLTGETSPAFRPDGKTFVTGGKDGSVRLRDASTGALLATILAGSSPVRRLAYRDDGRLIVAGFGDGQVRLFDLTTSKPIGPARSLRSSICDVSFDAGGRRFVAVDELGESRTWAVPEESEGKDLQELTLKIETRTGHRMADGLSISPLGSREWSKRINQFRDRDGTRDRVDDSSWHEIMTRGAEEQGNHFAALWHLDRLIAARPRDWTLFVRRARVRSANGEFPAAAADYEQAARIAPPEAVLDWQAHCAVDTAAAGRLAEALWYLDRLVAARPDDWTLLDDRSTLHGRLGHTLERAADRSRALELGADPTLVLPAAEELARAGRWREAAELLSHCGRQNPFDSRLAQAWVVASLFAADRASYLEARALIIAQVTRPNPSLSSTLPFLSSLTSASGVPGDTVPILTRLESARSSLVSSRPSSFHPLCSILGGLYLQDGQIDKAIARLEEGSVGAALDPDDLAIMALALARKGDCNGALGCLARLNGWIPKANEYSFWDVRQIDLLRREAEASVLDLSFPVNPFSK